MKERQTDDLMQPVAVHQYRSQGCADWYDGIPDQNDGHGPFEVRTLYTAPPPSQQTCSGCELDPGDSCDVCGAKRDAAKQAEQAKPVAEKDLMYSTVAMQERHAAFVGRAVATLEQVKREALAEQAKPVT